ncbi:MAG TPA: hypothetical protein VKV96_00125 [Roseiarcus sp.]|nr:hypothetical protein [Roseiarcus sp.]
MSYAVVEANIRLIGDYCREIRCRTVKVQIILDRMGYDQECGVEIEVRVDLDNAATVAEIQEAAFAEARALLMAAAAATTLSPSRNVLGREARRRQC